MVSKTRFALAILAFAALPARADFLTTGVFNWNPADGSQASAESLGNVSGLGTDSAVFGHGINGSGPNTLDFTGVSGAGQLPLGPFTIGSVDAFNGDITFPQRPFPTSLILSVSGFLCDDQLNCLQSAFGEALLSFTFTANTDDPVASADGMCIEVDGGDEQCAWQFELTSQSYDIVAQFGSLTVFDIIPTTPGAFVTIGRDPTQNVIRRVPVPEPGSLALLAVGFVVFGLSRR